MNSSLYQTVAMQRFNALILMGGALWFLLMPGALLTWDLTDPALRNPVGIPRAAWRVHQSLSPRYEKWANDRTASGAAAHVGLLS
jgi:hypothetical protein